MPSQISDEETPLLCDQSQYTHRAYPKKERTPLPWRQFSILFFLQVSEPITAQVIAPFLPQLIRDIGITGGEDSRVGYYVGLTHSLFYLTEACTIFHWSRISDQIGRKPVILTGLLGLSASMYCFGLAKTFWGLVFSRCLNGALNGNIGVMKSMVAEITDSTNMAQAYSILPFAWALGNSLGPLIGGSLAEPVDRFPEIFGDSAFLKKYPYFLPCSVTATVTALAWLIAFMFMTETTRPQQTPMQFLFGGTTKDDIRRAGSQVHVVPHDSLAPEAVSRKLPFRSLLVRPVLIAAGSYATFSLIEVAFRAVIPVFYATSIEMGGLDLDPPAIGIILSLLGLSAGIFQLIFFAPMYDWLGARNMFLVTIYSCIPMIALFPAINSMARGYGLSYFVWFLVGLQMALFIFASFAFAITFMFINAAAPNKTSIGATNGLAQVIVSVMRAVGPVAVNSAFSLSIEEHLMGGYFAYWVMLVMVGFTLWVGYLLPRNLWND